MDLIGGRFAFLTEEEVERGKGEDGIAMFREVIAEMCGRLNEMGISAAFAAVKGIHDTPLFRNDLVDIACSATRKKHL